MIALWSIAFISLYSFPINYSIFLFIYKVIIIVIPSDGDTQVSMLKRSKDLVYRVGYSLIVNLLLKLII